MVAIKRYRFWASFFIASCLAAFLSYRYIDRVYSLVNLVITVDRHQVLEQAKRLAKDLDWNIEGYQHVVSFESQDELQCFVELEAGGKDAFVDLFQSGDHYPYYWHVRFFKEKQVVEMHAWFSPEGTRLGFYQKLSEQADGAALSKEKAQRLADLYIADWCANATNYKIIEYDSEKRDTGRIDHDFTFERTDKTVGKGFFRFNVVVSGDVVTKCVPSIKIPDNFVRRYQQMRSANNLLASVGKFFMRFLYLFFFTFVGLLFFYRRKFLLFRYSSRAAFVVAVGMFLRGLNDFPLWWVNYNTIQPAITFIFMNVLGQFASSFFIFSMIFVTLVVSEAAGRFIYNNHLQFFKLFTLPVMRSKQVFEQVLHGYLLVPFMFLYVVVFGFITKTYGGWWSPAGSFSDPNIVACYLPWLYAVTLAFQAGFLEEVLCRALPLSMTAVLTRNSRYKKFWFVIVFFIVQALIFGAAHANYPNQPFYARLVELILPSFAFGYIYLQFGLLPGVITHFVYDVVWFSMPIFVSHLIWSKIIVVLIAGLPLWIVCLLYAYYQKFSTLQQTAYNKASDLSEPEPITIAQRPVSSTIPKRNRYIIVALGGCGFIAWLMFHTFSSDLRPLLLTKAQAIAVATKTVEEKFGAQLDDSWISLATTQDDTTTTATHFIWQVYGNNIYQVLQGSYLSGLFWVIRFVKFTGGVEDRGQEYTVFIGSARKDCNNSSYPVQAHVLSAVHTLPEHFTGADIGQDQAEKIAYDFINQEYNLGIQDTPIVSVTSDKFDARRDWTIVLQDTQIFDFAREGQARIRIKISGDVVTEYSRFIFVPETWVRADQEKMITLNLFKTILGFLLSIFIALGTIFSVMRLASARFGLLIMQRKIIFVLFVCLAFSLNNLCVIMAGFNTAKPWYDQLISVCLSMVTSMTFQVVLSALLLAVGAVSFVKRKTIDLGSAVLLSCAIAFIIKGPLAIITYFESPLEPFVGDYASIASWSSTIAFCSGYLKLCYFGLAATIACFVVLHVVQKQFSRRWLASFITCLLCGLALQIFQYNFSIARIVLQGLVLGCLLYVIDYLILQYDMTLLPILFGVIMVSSIVPCIVMPLYQGQSLDACIAMIVIALISLFFYYQAHKE